MIIKFLKTIFANISDFFIAFHFIPDATGDYAVKAEIIFTFFAFSHWIAISLFGLAPKTSFFIFFQSLPPRCPFFALRGG